VTGGGRRPGDILHERAPALALTARQLLYEEQPELSRLGENGRARTLEDFAHHFRALATMDATIVAAHVRYCEELFALRQFPQQWLTDAWRFMEMTITRDIPSLAGEVTSVLRAGVAAARVR
jgi:hypothetical protein